jgi:3-keto-5-aminohexanoate cleavage enzyme
VQLIEDKLSKPVIISAAITGGSHTRADNPNLPITPPEIAESSLRAADAGAAIVHLHVRESDGTQSPRVELYQEAIELIRAESNVLICVTTGGGGGRFTEDERLNALSLKPELGSLDAGSLNQNERVVENSPAFLRRLARELTAHSIIPEIECFDAGMIGNALRLGSEGLLPGSSAKWWFQICLGSRGGAPCDAGCLLLMRSLLPPDAEWSVLGFGVGQLAVNLIALAEGGHVRTGLEDNLYYRPGELAQSNAQLVSRIAGIARDLGRPVATPEQARSLLTASPLRT